MLDYNMTSVEKFNNFHLIFDVKCLDCLNENQLILFLGDFFDYINKKIMIVNMFAWFVNLRYL